ncbi:MAG: agmatinase [Turicibacter sp.]|nr:agmatinase [Turicibacter sp.]
MLQLNNNAQFLGMEAPYEDAQVVVFGIPFDGTTSNRPGTRFASAAIRLESVGLETYSPLLDLDLEDANVMDAGDVGLSIGDTPRVMEEIKAVTAQILKDGKIPFMVGGEHLVTLPVVEAVFEKYPDVHIIHFDAHTDLRDTFNNNKLSHATVIRRIHDFLGDGRIFQFGIRSGTKEEFDFARVHNHVYMEPHTMNTLPEVIASLKGKKVYVTIDLDCLDPSVFPGTGTPEPGGLTYREYQTLFTQLKDADLELVGADIVELSPHYDPSGVSTVVGAKSLRDLSLVLDHKSK